ncbi:hypothetical protein JZO81_18960 [Enterococcus hulanensis]|nr:MULTISPECIES: hypothetical protein [Enterococcus]MBO0413140.1 hypothetical protein [Enterococcus hulanensis]OTO15238.1 hypothetical protein A5875_004396 [Enterococcus sp. 3H8_DIV0648]
MKKYNRDLGEFQQKATSKEFRTVLKYVANEANRKQRELVGQENGPEK